MRLFRVLFETVRDYVTTTLRHPIGFLGVNLASLSGVLLVVLFLAQGFGIRMNPYMGMFTFLILPFIFLVGLLMMPIGHWLYGRRVARERPHERPFPILDFNQPRVRSRFVVFLVITMVNLTILAVAAYGGFEFMDSVDFCGKTCHKVMHPEFTAYSNSPHSRVRCVDCHIGPGASWFVKSKLSGARQLLAVTFNTYHRPIPTPVHNLRPSRETCEQCHWPRMFHGTTLAVRTHYQDDEANTPVRTVLNLKVGGGDAAGLAPGIHWHVNNRVEYRSDEKRERIYWVRATRQDGSIDEFHRPDMETLPDSVAQIPPRVMDCVDCHNRPTHIYKPAAAALDEAITNGSIPGDLPFIHREALSALTAEYPDKPAGLSQIATHLRDFYAKEHPEIQTTRAGALEKAVAGVQKIYADNVFPSMGIGWDTYPNHIGHHQSPGCFRCHDEELATKDGKTISQDCSTCHSLLAVEEQNPDILKSLFPEE
jgi:hypothetical protein